jgi:uncharacterized protein (TIGR00369 family)
MTPGEIEAMADRMLTSVPQAEALGLTLVSVTPARGSMRVPWREDLVGEGDVIAGGVVTALIDHCCGLAAVSAFTELAEPSGATATLDLRIDYMRPAAPRADVTCEAHCYKLTRTIAFVRATAFDIDRDDPVATAQAAFIVKRP